MQNLADAASQLDSGTLQADSQPDGQPDVTEETTSMRGPNWDWEPAVRLIELVNESGKGKWEFLTEKLNQEFKLALKQDAVRKKYNALIAPTGWFGKPFARKSVPKFPRMTEQLRETKIRDFNTAEEKRSEQHKKVLQMVKEIEGNVEKSFCNARANMVCRSRKVAQ
jgi:hypothetical protein